MKINRPTSISVDMDGEKPKPACNLLRGSRVYLIAMKKKILLLAGIMAAIAIMFSTGLFGMAI